MHWLNLGDCEILADQTQAETSLPLIYPSFNRVALSLVINGLASQQLPTLDAFWANPDKNHADRFHDIDRRLIGRHPVDLSSTDDVWTVSIAATMGTGLILQIFSFVARAIAMPIQECKTISCHREGNRGNALNVAPWLTAHDWPDTSLAETNNSIRDAAAVRVVENSLLTNQFTDYQQLLVQVPAGHQKAGSAGDQGIDTGQVSAADGKAVYRLADLIDARPLLLVVSRSLRLGPQQETAGCFFAVDARLKAKSISRL